MRRKSATQPPDGVPGTGPLATAIPDHGRRIVAEVDASARAAGTTPGMTVTKARTFAPEFQVVDAEPDADADGLRRLALWAALDTRPWLHRIRPTGSG